MQSKTKFVCLDKAHAKYIRDVECENGEGYTNHKGAHVKDQQVKGREINDEGGTIFYLDTLATITSHCNTGDLISLR